MTASSVELFACRVQVMGLPHTTSSAATAASVGSLQTPPRRPPLERVRGVSRNLFGSPQPGEVNNMFQQETKRYHSYVMQRYNIDINALRSQAMPTNVSGIVTDSAPSQRPTQSLPTLIDNEVKEHEQRVKEGECNLKRVALANCNHVKSPIMKSIPETQNGISGALKIVQTSTCVERQKPYARQQLLTENYNLRKNKIYSTSSMSLSASLPSPSPSAATTTSSSSISSSSLSSHSIGSVKTLAPLENTHCKSAQVCNMPQTAQADLQEDRSANTAAKTEEKKSVEENETNENSQIDIQRQRCTNTSLSLKVVLTTTSSPTPPNHKHQA